MNAAQILDACVQQVGTDASRVQILSLLNECYQNQLADARWFRSEATVGTTVSGQASYPIPDDIIEAYGVKVGGCVYTPIGEDVMWRLTSGQVFMGQTNGGGVYSQGYDSSGVTQLTLYPVPTTSGSSIVVYAARQGAALTDSSGSTPITPLDTHTSLIHGTAALVLIRIDERPDLAGTFQQDYDATTEVLRRRKNALLRGGQPAQLLVQGIMW